MKRNKFLFTFLAFVILGVLPYSAKAQYSLYVGESQFIATPDAPYGGWLENANWTVNGQNLRISEQSFAGAVVYPSHYFEGSESVTVTYTFGYYSGTTPRAGQLQRTFYITCIKVTGNLSETQLSMTIGQKKRLTYYPDDSGYTTYTNKYVTWESSNEKVAEVDNKGNVTAIAPGRATITFDPVGGPLLYCEVTVEHIPPTGISLPTASSTKVAESVTLTPTLTPSNATATITWKSSDEDVATVSGGKVTGKNVGETTITATTDNGLSATCRVTVGKGSVTISADTESGVYVSGKTIVLKSNRSDADIYYTLDGLTPSTLSTRYTEPIVLTQSATLKAIATGSNYETSSVLTREYQITTLSVSSNLDESVEQTPFFIPAVAFSRAVNKSVGVGDVKLMRGTAVIDGQQIVQDGVLYFVPDHPMDAGAYTLTVPENAVIDVNGEPNLAVQMIFKVGQGFGAMVKQVSAGSVHSLIVKTDGTLWACGYNHSSQLGDGTTTDRLTPVKIMDDVASVSAGGGQSLIVKTDGTLWACGYNYYGQLGDGTTTNRSTPVKIMDDVESVSAGCAYSLVVKTDGTLWACGYNNYGQLGDGTTTNRSTPVKIMDDVASVSAGGGHSLIVKTDGTLWACGKNNWSQLGDGATTNRSTPVKIMDDVASVSAGGLHSLAVKKDGSLWAWGYNEYGQLGEGTMGRIRPTKMMDGIASVSAGAQYSLIVKTDGSLFPCGCNEWGQLGDGTYTRRYYPTKVMDGVVSVSASNADIAMTRSHSLIIKTDGTLWACGYNSDGQLGDGTKTSRTTPVCIIPLSAYSHVTGVSLQQTSRQVALGSQYLIQLVTKPENSCPETVEFESSNPQVATVSARGIVETKAEGKAVITVLVDGKYTAQCEVEVSNREMEVTMSAAGYATFYDSRSAFVMPSGLSAQVVSQVRNNKIVYQRLAGNVIPKGVAVMLVSDVRRAGTYTLKATESDVAYSGVSLLRGSDEAAMTTGNGKHYKLSYGQTGTEWNDVFGWYCGATDGAPFLIEGHRAWLVVMGGNTRAAGFTVDGDVIESSDFEMSNDVYYDMQGRRLSAPTSRGLYIRNGKKILIK